MEKDLFLIYSLWFRAYWKPNGHGYTPDRELAGKYPRAEARAICLDVNLHIPPGEQLNVVIEEIDLNKEVRDYVSKKELREWCEHYISLCADSYVSDAPWRDIINKFCKEGL
jgi:hypothetical protein